MPTRVTTGLERLLDRLEKNPPVRDSQELEQISRQIASLFQVQSDEVAVLSLSSTGRDLGFLLPEKLRGVGTLPLSSTTALAARTARDRRADVINNFASSRHASVFEGVYTGPSNSCIIQKIMSAPILRGDKVVGVAQISRKGNSVDAAGADFTPYDLKKLQGLNDLLDRVLAVMQSA